MCADQTLARTLDELLTGWARDNGVTVEIWALPAQDVPDEVTGAVLATLREALSNVLLHSGADVVSVAVTVGPTGLRMTVSDNGVGIYGPPSGRGIAAMRGHFAGIGGTLSVKGVPGGGTTVTGTVPHNRLIF
ncbi:sensor histidine kinase [Streptosporangium saharense]|uniref:sensor histidine kinase n=1 Tax=Streptosporangium saharense TaxID=1706840 RepID=UPI0036C5FE90